MKNENEKCYYCENEFNLNELNKKNIYDSVLQQTIEAYVCEACENMIDDGLMNNFNQELN